MKYRILHDNDLPLVFAGRSFHNQSLHNFFSSSRLCQNLTIEEIIQQPDNWFDKNQFICCMSSVYFRMKIVQVLQERSAHFFSLISDNSIIGNDVFIGQGVMINHFNVIYDHNQIHDFSCITNHVTLSHEVKLESFSHVSPYVYLCFSTIGQGNFIGLRSNFFGYPEKKISTPAYCNFLAESRITRAIDQSGTWFGHRLIDAKTSLDLAL